jgi:HEAT repeat protein
MREEAEDSHAARAIDALGERLTRQHAETILRQSLQRKRRATARAAIRALDRIGGAEVVPPLVPVLGEEDEELAAAAATALGESGEPAAEKPLVGALHRDSPELRVAIAEGLGRVGSAVAVAPLRELAMQHPLDLGLRRASRQAIAQIHSRLKGATSGQLALAEADSGQLSLADEEAHGRLSLEGAASIGRAVESSADEEEASSSAPEAPAPRKREEG